MSCEAEVLDLARVEQSDSAICFVESAADTVVVNSMAALAAAVNAAPPGRNILIAPGTYAGGKIAIDGRGEAGNPVVIRPQCGIGTVTINGPTWQIQDTSHHMVIEKLYINGGRIRLRGTNQRISRCRWRHLDSAGALDIRALRDSRIDHCDWAVSVGGTGVGFGCLQLNHNAIADGTLGGILFDYNYIHDINPTVGGGGQEMIRFAGRIPHNNDLPASSVVIMDHCLFENIYMPSGSEDELISIKSGGWELRFCTFNDTNMRVAMRQANNTIVRSCWFENMRSVSALDVLGDNNLIIGNRFVGGRADCRAPAAGNTTHDQKVAGTVSPSSYSTCRFGRFIGNVMTDGAVMQVGRPVPRAPWVAAQGNNLWNNTGTVDTTTWAYTHIGTTFNEDDEPFVPAVKLTSTDVGLCAPEPL